MGGFECGSDMKWLDLFSGIGAYALGLEQAGHEVIGFCENDPWARKILKKHYPTKPISWCVKSLREALVASLGDSRVRILASQEIARGYSGTPPEKPQPDRDSSGRWLEPFAWYDLDSGLWRTWQSCLMDTWEEYLRPWPPAGMMQNGIAWQRPPLAHPTTAVESTFLPTPLAQEGAGTSRKRFKGSPNFRGTRTAEIFRTSLECPTYLNPLLGEILMGLPKDYTALETATPLASLEN